MNKKLKNIIFRITPHLIFNKISYYIAKTDKAFLADISRGGNVYIFLGCDYNNLGDYAITLAQKEILGLLYPKKNVFVVTINQTYSRLKAILKHHDTTDIVTIIGGGNMGELYYGYERKRNFLVDIMHEYNIISFPQSMVYGNDSLARLALNRSCITYSNHPKLLLLAREELSFAKMRQCFPDSRSALLPDVVLTLDKRQKKDRQGIILSMREDAEGYLSSSEKEQVIYALQQLEHPLSWRDTVIPDAGSIDTEFENFLGRYSNTKLVVTDRLHGMIFSYITGTPAVVFPNNNGKIEHSFRWIADCGFIYFVQKNEIKQLPEILNKMIVASCNNVDFENRRAAFYSLYKERLIGKG